MTEVSAQPGHTPDANGAAGEPVTAEAIAEMIAEFEQYRDRLVNDTVAAAKKAKMSKKVTMEKLDPELQKIDAVLKNLRAQHATLTQSESVG